MSRPEAKNPSPEGTKSFPDLLRMLEGGELVEDLADQMRDLQAKLSEHAATNGGAKGKLTLTLSFTHKNKGPVMVTAEITTKSPKVSRSETATWLTPGNNLAGSDPRQMELGMGPRALPAEAVRDAVNPDEAPPRAVKG